MSYSDQQFGSADPTFQNRVRQSLIAASIAIQTESPVTVPFHRERSTYAVQVMSNPDAFKVVWAQMVVSNAAVMSAATQNATVTLTAANAAAQMALVTDAEIDTAISGAFNTPFRTPAS